MRMNQRAFGRMLLVCGYVFLLLGVIASFVFPQSNRAYETCEIIGVGFFVALFLCQRRQS